MNPEIRTFETSRALAADVAACVAGDLLAVLVRRTRAALALPAEGRWRAVAAALGTHALDWPRVCATETDAAWPPTGEPDAVRTALAGPAAAHRAVSLTVDAETAEAAAVMAAGVVTAHVLPLDACVLSMGDDGRIAGLVPGGDRLAEALNPVCREPVLAVCAPGADAPRLSLTLPAIQSAPRICVLLAGDGARAALTEAMADGPVAALPVRAVLRGHRAVTAFHLAGG